MIFATFVLIIVTMFGFLLVIDNLSKKYPDGWQTGLAAIGAVLFFTLSASFLARWMS